MIAIGGGQPWTESRAELFWFWQKLVSHENGLDTAVISSDGADHWNDSYDCSQREKASSQ